MLAEDLAHETIVRALQARHQFDGHNMSAWLLRILCNVQYTLKRRGRFEITEEPLMEPVSTFTGEATCDLVRALEHVNALPRSYRAALLSLAENSGDYGAYNDVAREMGVGVGAVKKYIFRGRAAMRAKFAMEAA